jgi:hypothetical protein
MMAIQRYTKSNFGEIEKHDSGEFVYYIDYEEIVSKKKELINKLSNSYDEQKELLSLEYNKLFESKKLLLDQWIQSQISAKKYGIAMGVSLSVNIVMALWIWMN